MLVEIAIAVVAFIIGAAVGAANTSTVASSIAFLRAAEQRAQATLDQITAHKAS